MGASSFPGRFNSIVGSGPEFSATSGRIFLWTKIMGLSLVIMVGIVWVIRVFVKS